MKIKILIFVSVLILLLNSCEDSEVHLPKEDYSSAIQLEKGNFWVYESKTIQLGAESDTIQLGSISETLNPNDSIFIKQDTILDANRFFRLENIYGLSEWKRDSSGLIVDDRGYIEFDSSNTLDTLFNSSYGFGFMGGRIERIVVPAGEFSTIFFYVIQLVPAGEILDKKNPTYFNEKYYIARKVWYANNIGVVKSVFYYGTSTAFERNLLRFDVD